LRRAGEGEQAEERQAEERQAEERQAEERQAEESGWRRAGEGEQVEESRRRRASGGEQAKESKRRRAGEGEQAEESRQRRAGGGEQAEESKRAGGGEQAEESKRSRALLPEDIGGPPHISRSQSKPARCDRMDCPQLVATGWYTRDTSMMESGWCTSCGPQRAMFVMKVYNGDEGCKASTRCSHECICLAIGRNAATSPTLANRRKNVPSHRI
jgi:hypothetical protein